jgi:hypothetical protein
LHEVLVLDARTVSTQCEHAWIESKNGKKSERLWRYSTRRSERDKTHEQWKMEATGQRNAAERSPSGNSPASTQTAFNCAPLKSSVQRANSSKLTPSKSTAVETEVH